MKNGMKWYQYLSIGLLIMVLWFVWYAYINGQSQATVEVLSPSVACVFVTLLGLRSLLGEALDPNQSLDELAGILIVMMSILALIIIIPSNNLQDFEYNLSLTVACAYFLGGMIWYIYRKFFSYT